MKRFARFAAAATAIILCLAMATSCGSNQNAGSTAAPTATAASDTQTPAAETATAQPATAEPPAPTANETSDVTNYPWQTDPSLDSSDLPTWTGAQLKLTYWWGHSTGGDAKQFSSNDVTTPEIQRVTGITWDMDNSFDNGGQNYDVKLALLAATGDWPDLVFNMQNTDLYQFATDPNNPDIRRYDAAQSKLWDLTPYIQKYCPTLMWIYKNKLVLNPADNYDFQTMMSEVDLDADPSTIDYAKYKDPQPQIQLPYSVYTSYYSKRPDLNPDVDLTKYSVFYTSPRKYMAFTVRDDILTKIFPTAKTMQQIEELYAKQGYFTEADLLDVPLKSNADFYKFCRDIAALNITEDDRPVYALNVYSGTGQDNWPLMQTLFNGLEGRGDAATMYTYFDRSTQQIEYCFAQDFFKNDLYQMNLLVRDKVASPDSLIDSTDQFNAKLNNGEYAIAYCPWQQPDNNALKAAGKPYQYRRVYLQIPQDTTRFLQFETASVGNLDNFAIFKDKVSEDKLIQILRWYDYMLSDAASKMLSWGPRSAGLFTEDAKGNRTFNDPALAEAMIYRTGVGSSGPVLDYNLTDGSGGMNMPTTSPLLAFVQANESKFNAAYTSDKTEINPKDARQRFDIGYWAPSPRSYFAKSNCWADIWVLGNPSVPALKQANDNGTVLNEALTKILTASSDAQFDEYYQAMLDTANYIGYTEDARVRATKYFRLANISPSTGENFNDYLK